MSRWQAPMTAYWPSRLPRRTPKCASSSSCGASQTWTLWRATPGPVRHSSTWVAVTLYALSMVSVSLCLLTVLLSWALSYSCCSADLRTSDCNHASYVQTYIYAMMSACSSAASAGAQLVPAGPKTQATLYLSSTVTFCMVAPRRIPSTSLTNETLVTESGSLG